MRLLKTHSHTSERRGYGADKERQVKRERSRPNRKGQKKRQGKPRPYHLEWGGGENVSTQEQKTEVAPQPQRGGGEAKVYHRKGTKKSSHSSPVPQQSEWPKIPRTPPTPREGGSAGRKRSEHEKTTVLCPNFAARLLRPWPGTEGGGRQDDKTGEPPQAWPNQPRTTPNPAPQLRNRVLCSNGAA